MRNMPQNQHKQVLLYAGLRCIPSVLLAAHLPRESQQYAARTCDAACYCWRRKADKVGRPGLEHAKQLSGGLAVLVEAF